MKNSREAVLLAQEIVQLLGGEGLGRVTARADALGHAGDEDLVRFWSTVAYAILTIASPTSTLALSAIGPDAGSATANWRLMQRIEAYRHLAEMAETTRDPKAEAWGSTPIDAANGWRGLAADLYHLVGPPQA